MYSRADLWPTATRVVALFLTANAVAREFRATAFDPNRISVATGFEKVQRTPAAAAPIERIRNVE